MQNPILPDPGEVPCLGLSLEPHTTRSVDFSLLLVSTRGPFGITFSTCFSTSFLNPLLNYLGNLSWQRNGKRGESCSVCDLYVCSVCVLLLSGLPGQETKLNIKSPKNLSKNITKTIDFRTQTSSIWGPILIYPASLVPTCNTHLFFDRQTTDFLLKNGPQNGPQNH